MTPARLLWVVKGGEMSSKDKVTADAKPVVMVIEPEVLVRMSIAEFLRECGYKVIEGVMGEDVQTVLHSNVPLDIVFAEVKLPGATDGFALARTLRQTHPHIDVILTSGVTAAAEKSKDLCEEGPMKKPYRAEDVVARIRKLLEHRRSAEKP
jgi:DNA-binding response OmpR family regulator